MIQVAQGCELGPQEPAGVEDNPYGLALLEFVETRHKFAATSGRRPANVAEVIAILIFAEAFEGTSGAADPAEALLERKLPATNEVQGVALGFEEIGIDRELLLEICHRPALGNSEASFVPEINRGCDRGSTFFGQNRIFRFRFVSGRHEEIEIGRLRSQGWRLGI